MPAHPAKARSKRNAASSAVSNRYVMLAVAATSGWTWAFCLLAVRNHLPENYDVIVSTSPAWGFLALPTWTMALAATCGTLLCFAILRSASHARYSSVVIYWTLSTLLIPFADLLRLGGVALPCTFFEPLFFVLVTGNAIWNLTPTWPFDNRLVRMDDRKCLSIILLVVATTAAWWYWQGSCAYRDFLLGYHDFGHFARRVANTWEGRGWLMETPSLPAYWDHFNPALATLAPLWSVWPNAHLFIFLQAVSLASPALFVYGIARCWHMNPASAMLFALAYLSFPAVGLMNLNYSYGWHPVSLALPLIFAAIWLILRRQYTLAICSVLLACGFKETVLVTLACICVAMAFQARFLGTSRANALLASRLPWPVWLVAGIALALAFAAIFHFASYSQFQTSRFANLGGSLWEIAASPVLKPAQFWGQVLRTESIYFLLAITLPLGWRWIARGWPVLLAASLTVGVLLAWRHGPATSIAFQYITSLIPVILVAVIAGSAEPSLDNSDQRKVIASGVTAVIVGLTATMFFGAMPFSSDTSTIMQNQTYHTNSALFESNPRAAGTSASRHLREIIDMVDGKESAVLATGRIASHLLRVRRLESADEARKRWDALTIEAGDGRSGIEVFDWVVLDALERFQQSPDDVGFLLHEAQNAGYKTVSIYRGIWVLRRPEHQEHYTKTGRSQLQIQR